MDATCCAERSPGPGAARALLERLRRWWGVARRVGSRERDVARARDPYDVERREREWDRQAFTGE